MAKIVDARGLTCPQPVILTGKALKETDTVTVIVDDETPRDNVSRIATRKGYNVKVDEKDGEFYIHIQKAGVEPVGEAIASPAPSPESNLVVLISSDTIGRGSEELGGILMRAFMHTFTEVEPMPQSMIFINSGVKLVIEDSIVLEDLQALAGGGIQILVCGTCLDYFKLKDKVAVGEISNAYTILETLLQAGKVVRL
ncbi:TPA: sulfurtransferase-like selenium metabolism protein YedF [Candidatus Poribacteria bacterium]|nr:sulfurtransferase-like selenium metabolism protein YedF [Candidatus Poribacteria bacterium]